MTRQDYLDAALRLYIGQPDTPSTPSRADWTVAADLNTASFAGHTDWRVPTLQELQGILDYTDATGPAVNVAFQGAS